MEYVEVVSPLGEDEHVVYIPWCVYTSNYWLNRLKQYICIYILKKSMQENNQQDFTTEPLVCPLIYFLWDWTTGTWGQDESDHIAPVCPLQLQFFMTSIPSVN